MNIQPSERSWWEGLSRVDLHVKAQVEQPRMAASKIGQWRQINTEMDTPRRVNRLEKQTSQDDEW